MIIYIILNVLTFKICSDVGWTIFHILDSMLLSNQLYYLFI